MSRLVGLRIAALLLLGAGSALAQETGREQRPGPVFRAEATLVAVPVFVTDRAGHAVAGLTADDFEIQDGGHPVAVAAFQAVDAEAPVPPAPEAGLPLVVQAAAPRQFLFLFDLQFSPPTGIRRAREEAARFVRESLGPGDLAAAATFGRNGLRVLTNFTQDREYVARAIEGLGLVHAVAGSADPLGLSGEFAIPSGTAVDAALADELAALGAGLKREYQQRVSDLLGSMDDLARTLAALRGRKQVVLFSGGFAQQAWTDGAMASSPLDMAGASAQDHSLEYILRQRMRDLFRQAGVADVLIHTIDVRGLQAPTDVSSQLGGNLDRGEGTGSLSALAAETGGLYVRATNDLGRALAEVSAVSRRYYVLAFQPAEPPPAPGRPRELKVRVRRPGLKVSHRAAYVVPAPGSTDEAEFRRAAAETIAKGVTGGTLALQMVALAYRDGEGKPAVPVVLHVDGHGLAAARKEGRLAVQVYGYALAAGRVLDTLMLDSTLDLSGDRAAVLERDGLDVLTVFAAPAGAAELRFLVRAGATDTGAIRKELVIPVLPSDRLSLSPALFTRKAAGRIVALYDSRSHPALQIPFRIGEEPFLPDPAPVLAPGGRGVLCVFAWPSRAAGAPLFEASAELTRPGEDPRPVRIESARVQPDPDGFDRYVLTVVAPPAAPAGRYTLRLTFKDAVRLLTTTTDLTIAP